MQVFQLLTKCPVACHFLELVRTKTGLHRRDSFNRATLLSRIWTLNTVHENGLLKALLHVQFDIDETHPLIYQSMQMVHLVRVKSAPKLSHLSFYTLVAGMKG